MASWLFEVSKQFSDQLLSTKDIPPAATVVNLEPMNTLPPLTSTLDIIPSALSSQVVMNNNNYYYYNRYNLGNTKRHLLSVKQFIE